MSQTEQMPVATFSGEHIIFLHTKLRQRSEDTYLVDAAMGLEKFGHRITIYTTYMDEESAFDVVNPTKGSIGVELCGSWIPDNIYGAFRKTLARIKAVWLACKIIFYPPHPKPKVIVLDTDSIALFLLSYFGHYKTIYIHHFPQLYCSESFHCSLQVTSDLVTVKTIGYADEIILQTRSLQEIFRRSFPKYSKDTCVLHPCVDTGLWQETPIDIRRIVPDLPKDFILFVAFGEYKPRTNFRLILDALEHMFTFIEAPFKEQIHVVIAGHCSERSLEQKLHYSYLINRTKEKPYASQVTFLKKLPTVHKKTLIKASTAVVHPTRHDIYPGPILAAMSMGRPVITVNCGFPTEVLMHRLTGIMVEPDPYKFAKVMFKLALSPTLETFIGDMALNAFNNSHSFERFSKKLNSIIVKHIDPENEKLQIQEIEEETKKT